MLAAYFGSALTGKTRIFVSVGVCATPSVELFDDPLSATDEPAEPAGSRTPPTRDDDANAVGVPLTLLLAVCHAAPCEHLRSGGGFP